MKPLVGECLQCVKQLPNEVDKNPIAWFVIIHSVKKRIIDSWLYPCFYHCPIAPWAALQLGNESTMQVNSARQSSRVLILMDLKRPWNWLKNKIINIEEKLNETAKHSHKKCFIWLIIGRIHYREFCSR